MTVSSVGFATLHTILILVVFLVISNGFLRGRLKAQIDAALSVCEKIT